MIKVNTVPLCWVRGCQGCYLESIQQPSESLQYKRGTRPVCPSAWNRIIQSDDTSNVLYINSPTPIKYQSLTPLWWSCRCLWPRGSNWWRGPCRTGSCPRSPADAAGSLSVCGPGWWSSPAASGDSRTTTGWRPLRARTTSAQVRNGHQWCMTTRQKTDTLSPLVSVFSTYMLTNQPTDKLPWVETQLGGDENWFSNQTTSHQV